MKPAGAPSSVRRRRVGFLPAVFLAAAASLSAQASAPGAGGRLYVPNQDDATVTIVDLTTRKAVETLDLKALGYGANAKPHHTQVEPDGSGWYLTMIGAGKVLKFNRDNQVVASAEMEVPGLMTLHPVADIMFVGRSMSAVNPPSRVAVIRRSDMKILDEVDVFFPRPHALIADPRGVRFYTASLGVNQLARVDAEDGGGGVDLVDIPGPPGAFVQLAQSPDGRWLALTAQATAQVHIFDVNDGKVPTLVTSVATRRGPFEPAFSPDGSELWVTTLDANVVTVIETTGWTVTDVIEDPGFAQPHGIAIEPDGRIVWVTNRHQTGGAHDHEGGKPTGTGTAMAICRATRKVLVTIPAGGYAAGIGLSSTATPGATGIPPEACR